MQTQKNYDEGDKRQVILLVDKLQECFFLSAFFPGIKQSECLETAKGKGSEQMPFAGCVVNHFVNTICSLPRAEVANLFRTRTPLSGMTACQDPPKT